MNRPEKYGDGPITPEELEEVFGWALLNPRAVVINKLAPVSPSNLILSAATKADRQTGATAGLILQIGKEAETVLNERLERIGRKVEIGGMVTFSLTVPIDIGIVDENGFPILSGNSDSPYAAVALLHCEDILGYLPKDRVPERFRAK